MNILSIIIPLLLVLAIALAAIFAPGRRKLVALANVAEGFWPGKKGYYSDAAIATRYLLAKPGSDDRHAAICGASDIPIGVFTDEADAAEELVNVDLFGSANETKIGIADASISGGDFLVPAAGGELRTLPVAAGTYYIVGRALADASANEQVQFDPCFPIQRVVT